MAEILRQIVEAKKNEVEHLKLNVPVDKLEQLIKDNDPPLNFAGNLWGATLRVIAEVKRASPAKGMLSSSLNPVDLANTYIENGAAAISVLTNTDHFKGSMRDLQVVQEIAYSKSIPVLRKEFIFDPYQVQESVMIGADAILLIVGILSSKELALLIDLANELFLQCLVEVHDETELATALAAGADIIGINNRNLKTFETTITTTERLAQQVTWRKHIERESRNKAPETLIH